ncbi:M23 family metallopeptidase [Thioalkalivibrio sp. XN279]|uniref:M23 family metallopeptidase n=1 Tax=Thioalkalivibrio sp. XN279 TaxID=2714953 RepID=UPI001407B0FF|nr:M23 family metallopeptidase [Thioalkalivibrio sp. XN279]
MNLFIYTTRNGRTRQVPLSFREVLAASFAAVALVFTAGLLAGRMLQPDPEQAVFTELRTQLAAQQAELDAIRDTSGRNHDALAARLGQLSAHIIRLDALGQRLVSMAGLEEGEFNFGDEPALGGPEAIEHAASLQSGEITALLDDLDHQIQDRSRQLDILEALMFNRRLTEAASIEGRPIRGGWMSSGFGYRTDPFTGKRSFHRGLDFVSPKGSDVLAVAAGVVTFSGKLANYGYMVEIDHGNGLVTRYGHNTENLVAVGDAVQKGEVIALVGSTGRSTAPHVHLEVFDNGRPVNPRQYLR